MTAPDDRTRELLSRLARVEATLANVRQRRAPAARPRLVRRLLSLREALEERRGEWLEWAQARPDLFDPATRLAYARRALVVHVDRLVEQLRFGTELQYLAQPAASLMRAIGAHAHAVAALCRLIVPNNRVPTREHLRVVPIAPPV